MEIYYFIFIKLMNLSNVTNNPDLKFPIVNQKYRHLHRTPVNSKEIYSEYSDTKFPISYAVYLKNLNDKAEDSKIPSNNPNTPLLSINELIQKDGDTISNEKYEIKEDKLESFEMIELRQNKIDAEKVKSLKNSADLVSAFHDKLDVLRIKLKDNKMQNRSNFRQRGKYMSSIPIFINEKMS